MGQEAQERDTSDARVLSLSAADRSKGKSSPPVPRHCGGAGLRERGGRARARLSSTSAASTPPPLPPPRSPPPHPAQFGWSSPPALFLVPLQETIPAIDRRFLRGMYLPCAFSSWLRTRDYRRGDKCVLRLNIKRKFNLRLSCMMALLPGRF